MTVNTKAKRGLGVGMFALSLAIGALTFSPVMAQTAANPQTGAPGTGDAFMDAAGLTSKNKVQTEAGDIVASASARPSPVKGPVTYLMSAFPATSQNSMSLFTSYDGATFTSLATEAYKPSTLLRDPSIIHAKDGYYYVVYTTDWSSKTFGITRSKDLKHWEHITDVPVTLDGVTNTWAPEWFQDTDGQTYVVVSLSKGGTTGPFAAYLLKVTDLATGTFGAPQVMQGLENNHIDTFPIKENGKYYVFTKNETNKTIELASATSLTGPWTIEKTGNWAGWGDWIEGPALVRIKDKDGKDGWRIYFDEYRTKKYWYSDSFDGFKTWSARQELNGVTGAVRHFTVLRQTTAEVEAATAPTGKPVKVTWDKHSLMLDGQRVMIWAGEFHPFRLPSPSLWRDILQKMKATGYNTVSLYFDWGYHSPKPGSYDFTGVRDMEKAIQMAEDEGLYVIIRPGPYVNAELTMGGFPGWLARQKAVARTDDPEYINAMAEWQTQFDTIVARHQITNGGGKVIAFQIENELSDTSDVHKRYMKILADKVHADGITVPIFHNSAGRLPNWTPPGSTASFAVEGPTDLYAFDGYPGGSCTVSAEVGKPNIVPNWGLYGDPKPGPDGIVKVGQKASPNTPGYAAEIGGGWFDYWGSVGTYECTAKRIGPEYVRTFFGSSLINGLSMHSIYTAFGGTSWGWLPASVVYTSYDYGVGIDEARRLRPKEYALKQMGQFIQSATPLLANLEIGSTLTASSPNIKLYHDVGANGEGELIYVGHNPSNGLTDDTFTFDLTTKDGTYKLPQAGTLRLNGYDAKLLLANYALARQHLVYTTSDTQTVFSQDEGIKGGGGDLALLHGRKGEDGETVLRYKKKPTVTVLSGKATSTYDAKTGDLRLNYVHDGLTEVQIAGGGAPALLLLLADTDTATQFWRQDTVAGPVLERSAALVREAAVAKGKDGSGTLVLTGDTLADSTLDLWLPHTVNKVTFNGQPLTLTASTGPGVASAAVRSHWTSSTIAGPAAVTIPDLATAKWERRVDSPESNPAFDDSTWLKADMTSTSSTTQTKPPAGQPVLDMSQYGFHHGDVWYRGTFKLDAKAATANDTLDIRYGGGGSGFVQVWIDGKFVGQDEMPTASARPVGTSRAQFKGLGLKPGAHEISIMVRNNSHNWDLGANDEHKEARGLIYVSLGPKVADLLPPPPPPSGPPTGPRPAPVPPFVPSFATKIDWKIQGNKGGEDIADLVRGPMNSGGLYGERLGWHLPAGGDADKPDPTGSKWQAANPTDAPPAAGTYWLRTQVKLDLPKDQDVQLGLVFGDPSKPQSDHKTRALIFINGWNMGNFAANVGPQRTFILPPGILDPNGNNTIALAVTTDGKPENALEPVKLVVLNNARGGVPLELVSSPKTLSR